MKKRGRPGRTFLVVGCGTSPESNPCYPSPPSSPYLLSLFPSAPLCSRTPPRRRHGAGRRAPHCSRCTRWPSPRRSLCPPLLPCAKLVLFAVIPPASYISSSSITSRAVRSSCTTTYFAAAAAAACVRAVFRRGRGRRRHGQLAQCLAGRSPRRVRCSASLPWVQQ